MCIGKNLVRSFFAVSNQIDTIERCLSHIQPLLDQLPSELLVINTGSTDGTIEICKKYGAINKSIVMCIGKNLVRSFFARNN